MADERRRYLRVLFEETIQVEADDWTDPMATGLDISLNGTRFHCEHPLTEGATVKIMFRSDLKLEGEVRWCWPIEWYYQAAVEFSEITPEEQTWLRNYISESKGEPYPEYSEVEEEITEEVEENFFVDDIPDISVEDDISSSEGNYLGLLTPLAFSNKRVVIVDDDADRAEIINQYLSKRNQFSVGHADKKIHLWPLLEGQPADLILLSWALEGEDGLELLQSIQGRFPGVPVIFLGGAIGLEERLGGLNGGAADFLTRPISLSSISQSILKTLASESPSSDDEMNIEPEEGLGLGDDFELGDDFLEEDLELD